MNPGLYLMAVDVGRGETFVSGSPRPLFRITPPDVIGIGGNHYSYVPAADGRRFLVNSKVEGARTTPISVVLNWPALLKR
jgi:hypothetical protein